MQKWEYCTCVCHRAIEGYPGLSGQGNSGFYVTYLNVGDHTYSLPDGFNILGRDGQELVTKQELTNLGEEFSSFYIFKRPLIE